MLSACRFGRTLRFATLDQEDLLSPINHDTLQRSSSLRAMATADSAGGLHGDNYIGIALPVDITNMLHVTITALVFETHFLYFFM